MSLTAGTRFGSYEVTGPIGAGGMGEVYRARDTRLNRDVAVKVLPALFLHDEERLARFKREAQVLASLNHPNIASIYGFEDTAAGAHALIMEFVDGEDLSRVIARAPLPIDDALAIARQIADALEAAHEQGVIHRDLKPANIKVRANGGIKVLDFGLAKALSPQGSSATDALNSPTMSARATEMGVILGTAAYMSPEQAKGKAADQRADVWAFGVVLFEMIAGRQAFTGETPSEVMASVMKEEPDWTVLPADLPPAIRRLLRRCLEKDPKKRLSAIGDARLELTEKDAPVAGAPVNTPPPRMGWGKLGAAGVAGAIIAAIGFTLSSFAARSTPVRDPSVVTVLGPEGVTLLFDGAESAISPDGRSLVFTAANPNGTTHLWVRQLESLDARLLAGTETGRMPFWSPDSRQIAFFAGDKLKKMPAAGGTVEVVCQATDGRGGTWGSQNVIVFAPSNSGALQSVAATGGEPKPATTLDAARGETGHRFPWFLPDGRHFLFATLPPKNLQFDLFVGSIDGPERQALGAAETAAVYADPGHILFARRGVLFAQPFNARALATTGEAVAISDAPGAAGGLYSSGRAVSASSSGTIAYLGDRLPNTRLVWFDRSGRETGTLAAPEGRYQEITIAPDNKRATIVRFATQSDADIWIADLERGGATRFSSERALNIEALWSPDSTRILFANDTHGPRDLFVKPSSGATPEKTFYSSQALFKDPRAWSPDGKVVMFEELNPKTQRDLWILPMDGSKPTLYLQTPYNELAPVFSPDSKWVAYLSDESGRFEMYIDSFPEPRNKYRVTDAAATGGLWRRDGREIAIFSADFRTVLVTDVTIGSTVSTTRPRKLFDVPRQTAAISASPDLQRWLLAVPQSETSTSRLTLVFDWTGTLRKK